MKLGTSDTGVEFGRGAWHCKLSADTKIRVVIRKRTATPLALAGVGISLIVVGIAIGVEPGLILSGGILALLGADSCRRVQPVYVILLKNGAEISKLKMPLEASEVESFVADLSEEIQRLRSIAKPTRSEVIQNLVARAG